MDSKKKKRKVSIVQEEVILELFHKQQVHGDISSLMNETVHVAKEDSGSR